MAKFGKWIGGGLGFTVGGPMGALLGFAIGSLIDGAGGEKRGAATLALLPHSLPLSKT